jgi:hypothetical protein
MKREEDMLFEKLHKQIHPKLKQLMQDQKGNILSTSEIKDIYKQPYPDFNVEWVLPIDHCNNKTNNGACWCAMTEDAIFEYVRFATFRVR